jgi:hypothetical protein
MGKEEKDFFSENNQEVTREKKTKKALYFLSYGWILAYSLVPYKLFQSLRGFYCVNDTPVLLYLNIYKHFLAPNPKMLLEVLCSSFKIQSIGSLELFRLELLSC